MDFAFTHEQAQFGEALRRWVAGEYAFETRRSIIHSAAGVSDQAWAALAELGLTALPVPERQGGLGGTAVDMLAVMQEIGRGLVVEPYWATVLGVEFLRLGGGHGVLLERVAAGGLKLACALGEKQARHEAADIATTAVPAGGGYRIDGVKTVVIHGAQAGCLIVSARSGGARRARDGISLFAVPADTPGVAVRDCRTIDGQRAATVHFDGVTAPAAGLLGRAGEGWALLDAALDYGAGLLCFEALGALDALFTATLDYLKTRQQFGAPIGKFQALQHRMADMYIHLEQARSMAMLAAVRLGGAGRGAEADAEADERRRVVSAAKARIGEAARFIGQQALQLHGGMGMTDELPVSHYVKRLLMIEQTLGDGDHHLKRFMAQAGFWSEA